MLFRSRKIKEQDSLNAMMAEFGKTFPEVKKVLIDERDQFLASRIINAPGQKVVAVVGAGHVKGISEIIEKNMELPSEDSLSEIKKASLTFKILAWSVPVAIVAAIVAIGFNSGIAKAGELSLHWAMLTGGGAMLGTIIAGGHPLTVLIALLTAPFTTLIPMIGVGFFTALTQVYMRPPRVQEMETLNDDIWKVRRRSEERRVERV